MTLASADTAVEGEDKDTDRGEEKESACWWWWGMVVVCVLLRCRTSGVPEVPLWGRRTGVGWVPGYGVDMSEWIEKIKSIEESYALTIASTII